MAQLGKYQLLGRRGSGAYAEVYKALDVTLNRTVALKVLKPALLADEEAFARFLQEAQAAASLFHPHIATVLEVGQADGRYFIAMRYVDGPSLDKVLQTRGSLPWSEALKITQEVAEALEFAHARGLVHRDVKPQNILVSPAEGAVLTDFGLVKAMQASGMSTRSGTIIGTPQYIPPEVWHGESAGPAADQYALACVLVELLTGQALFGAPTPPAVMAKHFEPPVLPVTWPKGVPAGVGAVLRKALAKAPQERYGSVGEFAAALRKLSTDAAGISDRPCTPISSFNSILQAAEVEKVERGRSPLSAPVFASQASGDESEDRLRKWGEDMDAMGERESLPMPRLIEEPKETQSSDERKKYLAWLWLALGGGSLLCFFIVIVIVGVILRSKPAERVVMKAPTATKISTATEAATYKSLPYPTHNQQDAIKTQTAMASQYAQIPPTAAPLAPGIVATQISSKDGMVLVYVPVGEFWMGSRNSDKQAESVEKPRHKVYLDSFWIDRTEVTKAMFETFVQSTGYRTDAEKQGWGYTISTSYNAWEKTNGADWQHPRGSEISGLDDHPVVQVSWNDAKSYCEWAGRQLPTEAQWEKAARGDDERIYPWGDKSPTGKLLNFADKNLTVDWANSSVNDGYQLTAPVGHYLTGESFFGALDMAGNVWEWVNDWYDPDYYASSPENNPTGPVTGNERILRGGSWVNEAKIVRVANRGWNDPGLHNDSVGFRCALLP